MMEGCIPANRIDQFKQSLREGTVYKLQSFIVSGARSKYRAVNSPYRIKFTQWTKIAEVNPPPEGFPLFAYDAKPFDALQSRIGNNTLLSGLLFVIFVQLQLSKRYSFSLSSNFLRCSWPNNKVNRTDTTKG